MEIYYNYGNTDSSNDASAALSNPGDAVQTFYNMTARQQLETWEKTVKYAATCGDTTKSMGAFELLRQYSMAIMQKEDNGDYRNDPLGNAGAMNLINSSLMDISDDSSEDSSLFTESIKAIVYGYFVKSNGDQTGTTNLMTAIVDELENHSTDNPLDIAMLAGALSTQGNLSNWMTTHTATFVDPVTGVKTTFMVGDDGEPWTFNDFVAWEDGKLVNIMNNSNAGDAINNIYNQDTALEFQLLQSIADPRFNAELKLIYLFMYIFISQGDDDGLSITNYAGTEDTLSKGLNSLTSIQSVLKKAGAYALDGSGTGGNVGPANTLKAMNAIRAFLAQFANYNQAPGLGDNISGAWSNFFNSTGLPATSDAAGKVDSVGDYKVLQDGEVEFKDGFNFTVGGKPIVAGSASGGIPVYGSDGTSVVGWRYTLKEGDEVTFKLGPDQPTANKQPLSIQDCLNMGDYKDISSQLNTAQGDSSGPIATTLSTVITSSQSYFSTPNTQVQNNSNYISKVQEQCYQTITAFLTMMKTIDGATNSNTQSLANAL